MTIGERIKTLRTEKGMTQTELAELLQTTKQNIFKYRKWHSNKYTIGQDRKNG